MSELYRGVGYRIQDPYIIVTGDFNQWAIQSALEEFRDISETASGPTRGLKTIDRTFTNFEEVKAAGTLLPLQTDEECTRSSDHKVFYMTAFIKKKDRYRWLSYSYRYNNEESAKKFGEWLAKKDWAHLVQTPTSDAKAELHQTEINWATENFFPLRTTRRRSNDPSWINKAVKKLIKGRKRVFVQTGGRTADWKDVKKKVSQLIKRRCKKFQENQKAQLLADEGDSVFQTNQKLPVQAEAKTV